MQNSNTLLLLCLRDLHSVTSHVTTAERSHVAMEAPMTEFLATRCCSRCLLCSDVTLLPACR